jgi:exopolysaccharide production protein ExoZ
MEKMAAQGDRPTDGAAAGWRRINRKLLSIQYIRGGAAVIVLCAHGSPGLPQEVVTKMGLALDFFFIISGFLFVVISDERTRPMQFFIERMLRIVPLYFVLTSACFVLIYSGILVPVLSPFALVAGVPHWDWSFFVRSILFIPSQSPFEPDLNPLIPQGWTLNYEVMFYILFSAALLVRRRLVVPAMTLLCGALVLVGILVQGGPAFRFWTSPIIFEFVFGMWAGVAWQRGWDFRRLFGWFVLAWIPLTLVTDQFFVGWPFHPERMGAFPDLLIVLGFFLFLVAWDRRPGGVPEIKPLRLIGDAGYSIYLFHFIPIILVDRLNDFVLVPPPAYFLAVVGGGFAGGFACYYWLELPLARQVRKFRPKPAMDNVRHSSTLS